MDQAKAGFVATVSFRTKQLAVKTNPREAFWGPILQQRTPPDTREPGQSIERLEAHVLSAFPAQLHKLLRTQFGFPRELYAVFFRVSIEGYNSALLAVDIGGVKELAELLKGHIDSFTFLMEAFVPAAFADVLPAGSNHSKLDFEATIVPTAELSRVFAQVQASQFDASLPNGTASPTPAPPEGSDGWLSKVPRALVATAFSLLTPVALALIVFYFAAQMLLQERSELSRREAVLANEEQDLRKTEHDTVLEMQRENLELNRLLHPPPASQKP